MQQDDSTWNDRWAADDLADELSSIGHNLAIQYGRYSDAGVIADAVRALHDFQKLQDTIAKL